ERRQCFRSEVPLINDTRGPDYESLHPGDLVFRRRSDEREAANHGAADHEIHFSHRRILPLPFQDFEEISVIRLGLGALVPLEGLWDLLFAWARPRFVPT